MKKRVKFQPQNKTSWGKNAVWYEKVIKNDDSFQHKVILPALLQNIEFKKHNKILDFGSGTGFFAEKLAGLVQEYIGFDIGQESVKIAKNNITKQFKNTHFFTANAENIKEITQGLDKININLKKEKFDKIICVLAVQNIKNIKLVFTNIKQLLKANGEVVFVLNHPIFRVPKSSFWDWSTFGKVENSKNAEIIHFRGVTEYLSQKEIPIQMSPGKNPKDLTFSYHRPLNFYLNEMANLGFCLVNCQELISHKKPDQGPEKTPKLEKTRTEIPIFMMLKWKKYGEILVKKYKQPK